MRKVKLEITTTMVDGESTEAIIKGLREAIESGEFQKQSIAENDDIISVEAIFTELE